MKNESNDYTGLTLAQIFKKRRRALGHKLSQVEVATKIRGKYLVQIESGDYTHLPHDIYSKGFVLQYAEYLGLDSDMILTQYTKERGSEAEEAAVAAPKPVSSYKLTFTARWLVSIAVVVVVGAVLAYLSWQYSSLAAAPKLVISTPQKDGVVDVNLISIKGRVNDGADVFINDSAVLTDKDGKFNDQIALQNGINMIKITARNKLGKVTTLSRNILARPPQSVTTITLPSATFAGIAVGVKVGIAATALAVKVDDKEAFRGTMLAGTGQVFSGTSKITITTTNASQTSLMITNATIANKDLGPVGNDNSQRTIEFSKDTQFSQ